MPFETPLQRKGRKAWNALPRVKRAEAWRLAHTGRAHPDEDTSVIAMRMGGDGWAYAAICGLTWCGLVGTVVLWFPMVLSVLGRPVSPVAFSASVIAYLCLLLIPMIYAQRRFQRYSALHAPNALAVARRLTLNDERSETVAVTGQQRPPWWHNVIVYNGWLGGIAFALAVVWPALGVNLVTTIAAGWLALIGLVVYLVRRSRSRKVKPRLPASGEHVVRLDRNGLWLPERTIPWSEVVSAGMNGSPAAVYFDVRKTDEGVERIMLPGAIYVTPTAQVILAAARAFAPTLAGQSAADAIS